MNQIKTVLVANRGEIAIRIMRACQELNIRTIAIFSNEDINSLHRQKADESYLIGENLGPREAYLDIEGIIQLAKDENVDAIHPGYGFLSENETFARRCHEEGIIFVGPEIKHLQMFGNKTKARQTALDAGLPVIPGTDGTVESVKEVKQYAEEMGYPVIIKAVSGGGGKGMRIVYSPEEIEEAYNRTRSEAMSSFGDDNLYVEKYIESPKHIEVQILGDHHGNVIHLYERDCSIQRRHQKVVEVAPSFSLSEDMRKRLTDASLQLMNHVEYLNAGTVEFLVSGDDFYFIEVNPRIQVEHTITELITGIDIVKAQVQIAQGLSLFDESVDIPTQENIHIRGYAIQCRITTEDPLNNFAPDAGRITSYNSPGGVGIRLDAGDAFSGANITPHYDSLLVKISSYAMSQAGAIYKMARALQEMKINGVKTNIRFLEKILHSTAFQQGDYDTLFIDTHPELFDFVPPRDRGNKLLNYIANVTVNGFPSIEKGEKPFLEQRPIPLTSNLRREVIPSSGNRKKRWKDLSTKEPKNFKLLLDEKGPEAVAQAVLDEKQVLLTDTTLRDAHQSILTTRLRTTDMTPVAAFINETLNDYFSLEMWGGATFDVAYNFLKESPWDRLRQLRQLIPNIPFQMLLRASNAVGYTNYPDNVIEKFIKTSAKEGIDVFRIFDSLNWLETMKYPIEAALETGKLVEGAICYTGDILNPDRSSIYTLDYYVNLAKEIEALGVHTLAIKDMSGILKPEAAYQLIKALKETVDIPLHLHTHDTSGNGLLTYSRAIDAGVDIIDTANAIMGGQNSQPTANTLYYARQGTDRQILNNQQANEALSDYWKVTRSYYKPFETDIISNWPEVYEYEMPGGQYSNLRMQAVSLGLGERFDEVLDMYRRVNLLFGDIVKVTPSSKVVGDMALFMVQNELDEESVLTQGKSLDFPESVVSFFKGDIGQPAGGMNKELQAVVLKGGKAYTGRPGDLLAPYNFEKAKAVVEEYQYEPAQETQLLSYALYPKVYRDYLQYRDEFGDISQLDTPTFFYGMELNESITVELEPGKRLMIELTSIGPVKSDGTRTLFFNLNGLLHQVEVQDQNAQTTTTLTPKADRSNPNHIGAQMPGTIYAVEVEEGQEVNVNDVLLITEAMKMETTVQAPFKGVIRKIHCQKGDSIKAGDLLIEIEPI